MKRITQKDLEYTVERINEITSSPKTSWTRDENGCKANVGNYHLDYAYGGVRLVRMSNEHGGIRCISTDGYGTKRELFNWMQAFISGLSI